MDEARLYYIRGLDAREKVLGPDDHLCRAVRARQEESNFKSVERDPRLNGLFPQLVI